MFIHKDGKKISYKKIGENKYLVNLNTAYDNNCSEQETEEVTGEVLAVMLNYERKETNHDRVMRKRHLVEMPSNDYEAAKKGMVLPSAEDILVLEEIKLEEKAQAENEKEYIIEIISILTPTERRRLYLRSYKKFSAEKIADLEGVTAPAVRWSWRNARNKIEPYRDFLQRTIVKDWVLLLKSTNI